MRGAAAARRSASILATRTAPSAPGAGGLRMTPAPTGGEAMADMKRAMQQRELERRTRVYWYRHEGAAPPRAPQLVDSAQYVLGLGPVNVDEMLVRNALFGPSHAAAAAAQAPRAESRAARPLTMPLPPARAEPAAPRDAGERPGDSRPVSPAAAAAAAGALALVAGGSGVYLYMA
ncbi:hypothetical protein IWQ56_005181 [Coemansia nantahalensis]|nr:hypothetical protein IWQ56_005181 [Coemansia nantahalensis]